MRKNHPFPTQVAFYGSNVVPIYNATSTQGVFLVSAQGVLSTIAMSNAERVPGLSADSVFLGFGGVSARVGKGGFNVTSTCDFSDEMCQGKGPLFEYSTRDDLSSKTMSGN